MALLYKYFDLNISINTHTRLPEEYRIFQILLHIQNKILIDYKAGQYANEKLPTKTQFFFHYRGKYTTQQNKIKPWSEQKSRKIPLKFRYKRSNFKRTMGIVRLVSVSPNCIAVWCTGCSIRGVLNPWFRLLYLTCTLWRIYLKFVFIARFHCHSPRVIAEELSSQWMDFHEYREMCKRFYFTFTFIRLLYKLASSFCHCVSVSREYNYEC